MRFTHKSFVALGVAFLSSLFLLGCKSTDFAESPPASSYPPPLIPPTVPVVQEALANLPGLKTVWMQLGVENADAAALAEARGLQVVQNRCPAIEIPRLGL